MTVILMYLGAGMDVDPNLHDHRLVRLPLGIFPQARSLRLVRCPSGARSTR